MKQRLRPLLRNLCALALLAGGVSCKTIEPAPLIPPELRYPVGPSPVFLLTYFAYGPCMERGLGKPIPNYRSWTEERMERDIDRFGSLGIDVILLCMDVADLTDAFRQQRIQRFFTLLGETPESPKAALLLRSAAAENSKIRDTLSEAVQWLVTSGVCAQPGYWARGGRGIVGTGDGLDAGTVGHPALALLGTTGPSAAWHWPPASTTLRTSLSRDGTQTRITAGLLGSGNTGGGAIGDRGWSVPRAGGRSLLQALWGAFELQARCVCISSWNDFARGDFIEPNSHDQRVLFDTLRREIARVRLHCSGAKPTALPLQ